MANKKGALAESKIVHWLLKHQWEILERNYRKPGFELDIIATKAKVLLVGEVKARSYLDEGTIPQILSNHQIERIRKGIRRFISEYNPHYDSIRLDLFIVYGKHLNKLARYKDIELS